ncbi:MAG: glycosyltransferase family 1 protein [Saprospiraceae bacterium]|nr:glycosyltransferase family 1 protein [Saprospiraceae bacterium]
MKILIHGRAFPVAMWRWFDWALRDLGNDVKSVGCYQGDYIPWNGGMNVGYFFPPDLVIPEVEAYPLEQVLNHFKSEGWKPDMIVQASDTTYLSGKALCKNVFIKTDPHAVDYKPRLKYADKVFNMQFSYKTEEEEWLPYGYFRGIHKPLKLKQKYDVVFCGLQYDHRVEALKSMEASGFKVYNALGSVYDEYVRLYNQGAIAFNWSSKNDLPARFWEGLAMKKLVLTNYVPDLDVLSMKNGVHYVTFNGIEDALEKVKFYIENEKTRRVIAEAGYKAVQPHHYHNRAKKLI